MGAQLLQSLVAQGLLDSAKRAHRLNPGSKEAEKCNQMVFSLDRQLEVLAERLSTLPSEISPTPIYKQMEKLENRKKEAQKKLSELESSGFVKDEPCEMKDFKKFLLVLEGLASSAHNVLSWPAIEFGLCNNLKTFCKSRKAHPNKTRRLTA